MGMSPKDEKGEGGSQLIHPMSPFNIYTQVYFFMTLVAEDGKSGSCYTCSSLPSTRSLCTHYIHVLVCTCAQRGCRLHSRPSPNFFLCQMTSCFLVVYSGVETPWVLAFQEVCMPLQERRQAMRGRLRETPGVMTGALLQLCATITTQMPLRSRGTVPS